ncbi:MAG: SDR family oxidoreductase, partial [Chloroflexota bacterium]
MHTLLARRAHEVGPDYLYVDEDDFFYRNPLLDVHVEERETDIGISRIKLLRKPRTCYSCRELFMREHFFYANFCVRCGDFNYSKRTQTADLRGYTAVVTGARIKIGYAVALRLLRSGAEVIITTRFPKNAAKQYSQEPDFVHWKDRLHIYGLDMRDIRAVQYFAHYVQQTFSHLDILINNAAQTVRRPPAFYRHLLPLEETPHHALPAGVQATLAEQTQTLAIQQDHSLLNVSNNHDVHPTQIALIDGDEIEDERVFPPDEYDVDGQQIDNRASNSWTMTLNEVQVPELLEVYLVNAIAPSILVADLRAFMKNSPHDNRFIVNVSAVEGQFANSKQGIHPHTCMAKASLNMLTHSTAPDYETDNIYITSVDPGWVSDQLPHTNDEDRTSNLQKLPIDLADAAARVCDPIFVGVNDNLLYKDVFL